MGMRKFTIRVPASSANLGPGFDVLGLALSLYLQVHVIIGIRNTDDGDDRDTSGNSHVDATTDTFNPTITASGDGASKISPSPEKNLITKVASMVFRHYSTTSFPQAISLHIVNGIPLGRGLGSSGAATVAGVMLANEVAHLQLSADRIMEFCLVAEPHPDNIGASLFGGFVGSFLEPLTSTSSSTAEGGSESDQHPEGNPPLLHPPPPRATARYLRFPWSPLIKAVVIIPDYEVDTESARAVLSPAYTRADVVFNLQRVALLTHLLGSPTGTPDTPSPSTTGAITPSRAQMIYSAMQDRIHQPPRTALVPGLSSLLALDPTNTPGLLGIALSGAGPSIICLATGHFEDIATRVMDVLQRAQEEQEVHRGCGRRWEVLEPAVEGAKVLEEGVQ